MADKSVETAHNAFQADQPGTCARSSAEARIEELRAAGGIFVEAVRATRMPMAVTDPSLPGNPIVFANQAFLALSGYDMPEVLGQQPFFMNGEETDEVDAIRFRQALAQDRDELIESVQYRKDGSRFLASIFLSAFKDQDGRTLHQFLSYLDITRRADAEARLISRQTIEAKLRDGEQRHRLLVECFSQAVWETDADGVVVADSPTWRAYTGQTLEEWLGYGWLDAIHPEDRAYAERQWRDAVAARGLVDAEFRLRAPDGGHRWTNVRAAPVIDAEGRIAKWVGMNIDIDDRKRAAEALRQSEARYRRLFELMDQGFAVVELQRDHAGKAIDYRLIEMNPAFERQTGLVDAKGKLRSEIAPGNEETWLAIYDEVARTGQGRRLQDYHQPTDRWYDVYVAPVKDTDPPRVSVLFTDITERKGDETALGESEARYRSLFDSIDQGFCIVEVLFDEQERPVDYRFLEINPAFEGQTGLREALGRRMRDLAPTHEEHWFAIYGRIALTGEPERFENRADALNGRWYEVYAFRVGEPEQRRVAILFADVTESKRQDDALRESEERLRAFGEASADVLWIRNAETLQWEYLSPAFEAIYGASVDQALEGENFGNWLELIVEEDRERALAHIERVRAGESVTFDYRVRRPADGEIRWLRNTDFPMRGANGKVERIGGVGHDATGLKRVEAALFEKEARLRTLMEGIPQLVWRSQDKGHWTWSSPQWQDFTGQTQAGSRDLGWLNAVHPDDRATATNAWEEARSRGMLDVEFRVQRVSDGTYLWHHTRSLPVCDEQGRVLEWLGTTTDVQELKELQERQAVLVAELQHRTRNLMGVVRSMSDKTARASADLPDFRSRFRDRLDALARVQGLLSRLNEHGRVTFDELIRTELSAMEGSTARATLDGPSGIRLRSSTVQTLAMALHELATNAVKYGALGQPSGRLAIRWSLEITDDGTRCLHIDWRESDVEMSSRPLPRGGGQGRDLIERALPYQLGAKTSYELGPDGVHCTISVPVSVSNKGAEAYA